MTASSQSPGHNRHIVFVHQTFSAANSEGSGRANAIAIAVRRAGYRVSIIGGANSYLTGQLPPGHGRGFIQREEYEGCTVIRPWTYSQMHKSFAHRAFYFFAYMFTSFVALFTLPKADVIVGGSPPITVAVSAALTAIVKRTRFVMEVRDLWPAFPIQMGIIRSPWLIWVSQATERFLYGRASHVVINSPGFAPHLRAEGISDDRISLVPNGIDLETFFPHPKEPDFQSQLGMAGKFVVVYVGAHGPANSLDTLLQAAALLRDDRRFHILLVGDGKSKRSLEALRDNLQLANVTFLPPQPKQEIPRILAAADVGFLSLMNIPMFTTTYPNKLFDYLACGLPVLTTVGGVSRSIVEDAQAGEFVAHDPQAIAERIRWFADHQDDLRTMGANARAAAVRDWGRDAFANDFVRLMDRITACP